MTATITREEAAKMLTESEGRIFTVTFIKRTTGEMRVMNARTGVKKHLRGGEAAYSFSEKMLLSVYDMQAAGYRCIPLEAIISVVIDGTTFTVAA